MSLQLRWTEQAVTQLGAIAECISLSSPMYAEQIVERIPMRLRQVQKFPACGRQVPEAGNPEIRQLVESPYRIVYRASHDTIEILAIVHGRQDLPASP